MSVSGASHSKVLQQGFVYGGPRLLLRIEGLAYASLALICYAYSGYSWWLFATLILVPDVSMLGYLINPTVGAVIYNLMHMLLLAVGTIWVVHIGADRALGYELKYATAFGDTHLGHSDRT